MAPNVLNCVFTLEESVCVGGHGWNIREISFAHKGLKQEARIKFNETIPLWYPYVYGICDGNH
jgi:hypothetical protein